MLAGKTEVTSISNANQSVYNSIRRFAIDGLNDLIRVLMENIDDALFELSDKVENDRERNLYFEAMREIRIKRESLQHNFDAELRQRFEQLAHPAAATDTVADDGELSLVELEDFEDSIAIDNMIKKARPHFEDELFAVSERLRTLLRRKEIVSDENPLDPKAICDSFHNASDVLDTEIQVRLIFYKLFDRYVVNSLGHFYRELNALFVQKGVLPDFQAEQERMRQTTRFMANRIRGNPPAAGAGDTPAAHNAALSPGAAPTAGISADDRNLYAALQQAVGGFSLPGGGAGMVADGFEPAGGLVGDASPGGFVAALSGLQMANLPTRGCSAIDPQQLRTETQQHIQLFRQQNQHQVAAADDQTIDVVSMLFDFFFDDEALPAPIKVLIGRLQIPILKLAILDKEFFNQKKHPARKLLDSLSRAALGWGDNPGDEQALIEKAEEIVNFLINEFEEDVAVFDRALEMFDSFLQTERDDRRQAEQALHREEEKRDQRIQQARESASVQIEQLTRGRDLGFDVIDFLETTWSSVLFNAYLAMGADSDHCKNLARIGATLVWTLKPRHSEAERNKILKTIPSMLRALSRGMDLVKIKTEVQNRIFQMLAQQHAVVVKLTARNIAAAGKQAAEQSRQRQAAAQQAAKDKRQPGPADIEQRGAAVKPKAVQAKNKAGDQPTAARAPEPADTKVTADLAETGQAAPPTSPAVEDSDPGLVAIAETARQSPAPAPVSTPAPAPVDATLAEVDQAPAMQVIENLEQFTSGVNSGEISFAEEIVLVDESGQDLELTQVDECIEQANSLEIGSWVEFSESDTRVMAARLSWKSQVSGSLVFVNRKGQRVRNMSINDLANELRAGKAACVDASSVFDRAVYSIMNKVAG